MQNETAGWVKSIHETRHGALLGLVMIGPHVTDMVEAGVIAIDAGATVETVADGIAPHPTLSEAIKGASLVALGRAIDLPNLETEARNHEIRLCDKNTDITSRSARGTVQAERKRDPYQIGVSVVELAGR